MSAKILAVAGLVAACAIAAQAQAQKPPPIQIPQPGVPQITTLEGKFIRVAYNNEGYVILGYQLANRSVGEPWMLLEMGTAILPGVRDYTLKREHITLDTPDGKTLPLPSIAEYRKNESKVQALQQRARVTRDVINYFPPMATRPCRMGFFSDLDDRAMPWDEVPMTPNDGCGGRLYIPIPGGIQYGQHWLNVKFAQSLVRVPFRILTADEEKRLSKEYKDIKRQVEDAFRKK